MKKILAILMTMVLLCTLASCGKSENLIDPSYDPATFMNREEATLIQEGGSKQLNILQVNDDCFFGSSNGEKGRYKINTENASEYCVGDNVIVHYMELYRDAKGERFEIDAIYVQEPYEDVMFYKPVIYLYPLEETEVSVSLDIKGEFTITEPIYENGWTVVAKPNGTLLHQGKEYPYLFWEAKLQAQFDLNRGFCVAACDTETFLKEKLAYLGLNKKETAEFLEFWLPKMQQNPYNLITFQGEEYTSCAPLAVEPAPQSVIRVFMVYQPLQASIEIEPQALQPAAREGYALIEWGGAILPQS